MSLARLKDVNCRDRQFTDLLKKIVGRISNVESRVKIIVFGSFVAGKFTAESDLDLAVIVPDHWQQGDFLSKVYAGGFLSSWPLDLLVFRQSYFDRKKKIGGICVDIATCGVELYPHWRLSESGR